MEHGSEGGRTWRAAGNDGAPGGRHACCQADRELAAALWDWKAKTGLWLIEAARHAKAAGPRDASGCA